MVGRGQIGEWSRENNDSRGKVHNGKWESEEAINTIMSPADILADEILSVFRYF